MDYKALYAAVAAANLHHAAALRAIDAATAPERPMRLEAVRARHALEMATLGCSSVPACPSEPAAAGRCALPAAGDGRAVPDGAVVAIGGSLWTTQNGGSVVGPQGGLTLRPDGQIDVVVHSGERPWFDPPRKFRAEFCGLDRFAKGIPIRFRFAFRVDPATNLAGLNWSSLAQVHQADLHYADGTFINASPVFALNLVPSSHGDVLEVRTGSAVGPLREPDVDPATGRQRTAPEGPRWCERFPEQHVVGRSAPLARDRWHTVDFTVVDGHGKMGQVLVCIDNTVILDQRSAPTRYGYADALASVPFAGGPQDTGSYLKFGVYAGTSADNPPPEAVASIHYKNLRVGP